MNILAVDDERAALDTLAQAIMQAVPDAHLNCFADANEALAFATDNPIDVAFLDVRMNNLDGLALADKLVNTNHQINIIFVSGYQEYAYEAMTMHAIGFIRKPVTAQAVAREMEFLRHDPASEHQRVRIQCFGSFGVFVEDKPVMFTQAKPKELLAYIVHQKGAPVSTSEIAAILWEDRPLNRSISSQLRNAVSRLTKILEKAGAEDILIKEWNCITIDTNKVSCDYYNYIRNRQRFAHTFNGEYMTNYSWGETTLAFLNKQAGRKV